MTADDLMKLVIRDGEHGTTLWLDNKELHHVGDYKIESSTLPGAAKLSIDVHVKFSST